MPVIKCQKCREEYDSMYSFHSCKKPQNKKELNKTNKLQQNKQEDENATKKCNACTSEIPLKAEKCRHCGTKQSEKTEQNIKGVIAIIQILLIVGFLVFVFSMIFDDGDSTSTPPQERIAEIKISAIQLSQEYEDNTVAADARYEDNILEISGVIDSIGKDILDNPYVMLQGRELSFFGIQCMFSKSNEPELATLSKGESITLKGKVSGELIGSVIVRGCTIVK